MLLGRRCTSTFLLRATSTVIWSTFHFVFYDRICFSIEITFQKWAGCHTSCEQQKSYGKTPREANLYGNWCVCKGLSTYEMNASLSVCRVVVWCGYLFFFTACPSVKSTIHVCYRQQKKGYGCTQALSRRPEMNRCED